MSGNTSVRKNTETDVIVEKVSSAHTCVWYIHTSGCVRRRQRKRDRERKGEGGGRSREDRKEGKKPVVRVRSRICPNRLPSSESGV